MMLCLRPFGPRGACFCILLFCGGAYAQPTPALKGPLLDIQVRAEEGRQDAQLELGRAYLAGGLVPRDRLMAYFWFNVAVAGGGFSSTDMALSNEARAERDKLEKLLAPAQIAQAETMGREWKPKEVLESEALKEKFLERFNQAIALGADPKWYQSLRAKETTLPGIRFHSYETNMRFPGASSQPCSVSVPSVPPFADSEADTWTVSCPLFASSDPAKARSAFESVAGYVWDLVPAGWFKDYKQIVPKDVQSVGFYSRAIEPGRTASESPQAENVSVSLDMAHSVSISALPTGHFAYALMPSGNHSRRDAPRLPEWLRLSRKGPRSDRRSKTSSGAGAILACRRRPHSPALPVWETHVAVPSRITRRTH
jgi:hypothetical protein